MTNPDNKIVELYGARRCFKSNYYADELTKRGVAFDFYDVELEEASAERLRGLYEDGGLKFPTLTVDGKRLRNPLIEDLDKWLERKEIRPRTLRHDPTRRRYLYLLPESGEAFVTYSDKTDPISLTDIQVPDEYADLREPLLRDVIDLLAADNITPQIKSDDIQHLLDNASVS